MTIQQSYYYGTGRRKTAVARVRVFSGNGAIVVNGKSFAELFPGERLQKTVLDPLRLTDTTDKVNAVIKVEGGGVMAQAGAMRHGIAVALTRMDEALKPILKKAGFLTRDPRMKERKKYGLRRARKAPQYTKR